MKKFLYLKYILIIIIAILGILFYTNYGLNVKNSKTYNLLNNSKNNYTLTYEINIGENRTYTIYCTDNYYLEYSFYDSDEKINYMKQEENNGIKSLEIKGTDINGNYFYQNLPTPLQISKDTNAYIYSNELNSYLKDIENLQFYRKGFKTIDGYEYYYEEFKLKDNKNLCFLYKENELSKIQGTNLIQWNNIKLLSEKNNNLLENAEEKFSNYNNN